MQVSSHERELLNGPNAHGSIQPPSCSSFHPSTIPVKGCHNIDVMYEIISHQSRVLKLSPSLLCFGQRAVVRLAKSTICCASLAYVSDLQQTCLVRQELYLLHIFFPDF